MTTPNTINLELLPNVNGLPGPDSQALESFQLVNQLPSLGSPGPPVMVDSVQHPLLAANTGYWLVATASQATEAIWFDNILSDPESEGTIAVRVNDGLWHAFATEPIPALAILGSPTPEPATLGLLGIGALGLLIYRCRRRLLGGRLISEGSHARAWVAARYPSLVLLIEA